MNEKCNLVIFIFVFGFLFFRASNSFAFDFEKKTGLLAETNEKNNGLYLRPISTNSFQDFLFLTKENFIILPVPESLPVSLFAKVKEKKVDKKIGRTLVTWQEWNEARMYAWIFLGTGIFGGLGGTSLIIGGAMTPEIGSIFIGLGVVFLIGGGVSSYFSYYYFDKAAKIKKKLTLDDDHLWIKDEFPSQITHKNLSLPKYFISYAFKF